MTFGWSLGPAAIYFFGYLLCLPEVLRDAAPGEHQTLRQGWTDFNLLSSFIAALVILFAYAWAILGKLLVCEARPRAAPDFCQLVAAGGVHGSELFCTFQSFSPLCPDAVFRLFLAGSGGLSW